VSQHDDQRERAIEADEPERGESLRVFALLLVLLVLVGGFVAVIALTRENKDVNQSPDQPAAGSLVGNVDEGRYQGTLLSFQIPRGVTDVSGRSDGVTEDVAFTVPGGSGRIGSAPGDPRQSVAERVSVYPGLDKRGELEVAGARGVFLSQETDGLVMLMGVGKLGGRDYELQIAVPVAKQKQGFELLRQIAASLRPTAEAAAGA
jgi:hypothetical protein